jgi:hypothetical protein
LCASTNGVDDRHRWHAATGIARRRQLTVPDHREVPAAVAVRARGDQFVDRGQCTQSLAAPQHVDGRGRVVAHPGGGLVAIALGKVGDMREHRIQCAAVAAFDQLDGAGGRGGIFDRRDALRRGAWRELTLGTHVQPAAA